MESIGNHELIFVEQKPLLWKNQITDSDQTMTKQTVTLSAII